MPEIAYFKNTKYWTYLAENPYKGAEDVGFETAYRRDHGNKGNNKLSALFSRRETGIKTPFIPHPSPNAIMTTTNAF